MIDQSTFSGYVREALAHLYDLPYLQGHPLAQLLPGPDEAPSGETLNGLLVGAIEELRPPVSAPARSTSLRRYRCLALRYLEGATAAAVARELGMSLRQCRRDRTEAVSYLALVLWTRYRRLAEPRAGRGVAAREAQAPAPPDALGEVDLEAELTKLGAWKSGGSAYLPEVLRSALAIVGRLAAARQVRFATSVPDDLPPVSMDGIVLRQALLNSLAFAVEVGRGGLVTLSAVEVPERINLTICAPRPDAASPLGRREVGVDQTEALLEASRRLLEAQGGMLQLGAAGGGNSRIVLALPTVPGITMLVVDDNPDIADLFRRFLRGRNCRIVHASTGQKALQLAREHHLDVISLDLLMPTQDGWDILAQLKSDRETSRIPVIICSILPDRELALSMGAATFLPKPVLQADLAAALQDWIASRSR